MSRSRLTGFGGTGVLGGAITSARRGAGVAAAPRRRTTIETQGSRGLDISVRITGLCDAVSP